MDSEERGNGHAYWEMVAKCSYPEGRWQASGQVQKVQECLGSMYHCIIVPGIWWSPCLHQDQQFLRGGCTNFWSSGSEEHCSFLLLETIQTRGKKKTTTVPSGNEFDEQAAKKLLDLSALVTPGNRGSILYSFQKFSNSELEVSTALSLLSVMLDLEISARVDWEGVHEEQLGSCCILSLRQKNGEIDDLLRASYCNLLTTIRENSRTWSLVKGN